MIKILFGLLLSEKNGKYTTAIYQAELSGDTLINEKKIYEAFPTLKVLSLWIKIRD